MKTIIESLMAIRRHTNLLMNDAEQRIILFSLDGQLIPYPEYHHITIRALEYALKVGIKCNIDYTNYCVDVIRYYPKLFGFVEFQSKVLDGFTIYGKNNDKDILMLIYPMVREKTFEISAKFINLHPKIFLLMDQTPELCELLIGNVNNTEELRLIRNWTRELCFLFFGVMSVYYKNNNPSRNDQTILKHSSVKLFNYVFSDANYIFLNWNSTIQSKKIVIESILEMFPEFLLSDTVIKSIGQMPSGILTTEQCMNFVIRSPKQIIYLPENMLNIEMWKLTFGVLSDNIPLKDQLRICAVLAKQNRYILKITPAIIVENLLADCNHIRTLINADCYIPFDHVTTQYLTWENIEKAIKKHPSDTDDIVKSICNIVKHSRYFKNYHLGPIINRFEEFLQIALLNSRYDCLRHIENQTEKICKVAVNRNGYALEHVKNQTEEICKIAVKQNGNALKYVENQTDEICKIAVKRNGRALKYVKKQTEEICKIAVNRNIYALKYVKNQTEEICKIAVNKCYYTLAYVERQTDDICKIAIKKNYKALKFVKEQTPEIIKIALDQNTKAIKCVIEERT